MGFLVSVVIGDGDGEGEVGVGFVGPGTGALDAVPLVAAELTVKLGVESPSFGAPERLLRLRRCHRRRSRRH